MCIRYVCVAFLNSLLIVAPFLSLISFRPPHPYATSAANGKQTGASAAGSGFWGFAAALSANIKQQTAEVAESFQRTSWVSELSNLADGLEKERVGLAERAHHVTDRLGHAMPEQVRSGWWRWHGGMRGVCKVETAEGTHVA